MYRERASTLAGAVLWHSRPSRTGTRVLPDGCLARAGRAFAEVATETGYADQAHLSRG
jgi:hypothetical protein